MISFSVLNLDSYDAIIDELFKEDAERERVRLFTSDIDLSADAEYAISKSHGCLLIRICDFGRYAFTFPEEISEGADVAAALCEIEKYVIKEEIPYNLADVGCESLHYLRPYLHLSLDKTDAESDSYFVMVQNECQLLSEIPSQVGGRVSLNALTRDDIPSYSRLCRDEELLKYWGYDYRLDYSSASDEFFFDSQEREFMEGVAMTLAIRTEKGLVGSLELYAFDFHGGAEIDVRLFPEEQGRGYAREALELAFGLAKEMGLTSLKARVMNQNLPSRALFEKYADRTLALDDCMLYTLRL